MLFSDAFDIDRTEDDDWFDPILHVDTKLFVDPFMIYLDEGDRWQEAHAAVVAHFDRAFMELAQSGCRPRTAKYKGALALLAFPEPSEFCLGYAARGTRGAGSGAGFAKVIAKAMCAAITRGVHSLEHFEELGILDEGIGPDRISDITCTILKPFFIQYTQEVAARHGVELRRHRLRAAEFDSRRVARAQSAYVELPTNPVTDGPVLLVPKRFLRDLPVLNAEDWFDSNEAADVRREFSADVLAEVNKPEIVAEARKNLPRVESWIHYLEHARPEPYDLQNDPLGVYQWAPATQEFARENPLALGPVESLEQFFDVIETVVQQFKHYVEERRGWKMLWNDNGKEKPEEAAQLLFQGLVVSYCAQNNVNLDREVELGRGPVDFKFSRGYDQRALMEVKKLHNGRFWNGLHAQLRSYLRSEQCENGWLLAVQYKSGGVSKKRRAVLGNEVADSAKRHKMNIRYELVDARPKKSASKLEPKDV